MDDLPNYYEYHFRCADQAAGEYNLLAWDASINNINIWLGEHNYERFVDKKGARTLCISILCSYISCIGKIKVKTGEELYKMSRDDLRENCGMMEGIRLFSLLQRDRKEVHNTKCGGMELIMLKQIIMFCSKYIISFKSLHKLSQ